MNFHHFVEKRSRLRGGSRLSDEEYAKVLDNIVVACVDVILINSKGEMLLGKRSYYPPKGWWIVGGRMWPGESFAQAAARNMLRELGLIIAPERFSFLGTYSFVWAIRRQPPSENGCHMISVTMTLAVTDLEVALINPNEEFKEIRWWEPNLVAENSQFFPPVRRYARDILAERRK